MSVAYGEQQRNRSAMSASGAGGQQELERQYHVVLQDSLGVPALGFREGTWFRLTVSGPQPLQLRGAIRTCPHAAGSIVQIACWWMRENPMQPRSLDLATELALTVGELVRVCPADGLGTTSMDLLPMAMAAVAQSGPPVTPAPALPSGSSAYAAAGAGSSAFGSTPALGSSSSSVGSSDAFGSGSAFGSGAYGSGSAYSSGSGSGTYAPSSDGLYSSGSDSTSAYGQTSGYAGSGAYSSTSGSAGSAGYSSTGAATSTSAYGSSSSGAYSTSAASTDAYGSSASGYGSSSSSASGYSSSGGYGSSSSASGYETNAYAGLSDPLTDPLVQSTYSPAASAAPSGQSAYSNGTYAASGSYDSAPTSYLPAATGAAAAGNGWFEPADGTGTGGFPAVPPAPVMGRQAPPMPPAPKKPYPGANPGAGRGGYPGAVTQQAALPPASRPRESGADWEPRAAAPRRPAAGATGSSHQPRPQQPQQAAPRQVPGAGASGQPPRPRPQQPRDGYGRPVEPQQDLGRSSDRNGAVPPRRPAAAAPQQRGTMGQRPASRPRRPSER